MNLIESEKKAAAWRAAEMVKPGMTVGIGSGSTVYYLVKRLGKLVTEGLDVRCVSTSHMTTKLALESGLQMTELSEAGTIDLTIDGADEIDRELNGIKGGGGALLFEKIVALNSKRNIWIADSSKTVERLGKFPLPVEVIPFGHERVFRLFEESKFNPLKRMDGNQEYKTDSGNLIIDLNIGRIENAKELDKQLKLMTGVVETGLFCGIADMVIVAEGDKIRVLER